MVLLLGVRAFLVISIVFLCCFCATDGGFTTTKIGPKPIWNFTETDKLKHDLLLNYDKFARPAQHYNATKVAFGLTVRHFELNEMKLTFTIHAWIRMLWSDEKLSWNSSDYGGLTALHLAEHEVWQPDIFLYNSASNAAINTYGTTHCIVYSDGQVLWVPPTQFTSFCELNLRYWPFDKQVCNMQFGSWTHNGYQIDLQVFNNETDANLELLVLNTEWQLSKATVERRERYFNCCDEPYIDVNYKFHLTRRSPSYKALIITPAFVIVALTLVGFWLPPQATEKIILNGCTAIIICLFLLYFTQKLPVMGDHTPLIVMFYTSSLYMSCFTMIISVTVLYLSKMYHASSLPWIIKQPLTGQFGKILGLNPYILQTSLRSHRVTAEEMRDHQVTDFEDHNSGDEHQMIGLKKLPIQQDWILLAAAIDRIGFCLYTFVFTILLIAYSV